MKGRQLSPTEIQEARLVFAGALDYTRVRVLEGVAWTDALLRLSRPAPGTSPSIHNAVTLGWKCHFPVRLQTSVADLAAGNLRDMAWLVHELTHAWQYQHTGWQYLWKAVGVQVRLGAAVYAYGGEKGLRASTGGLSSFNLEQQADIARDYYWRLRSGQDFAAWERMIQELRLPSR
jgi:hypothetical protein